MKKIFEGIRKHPKTSIAVATGVLIAGGLFTVERIGAGNNPTTPLLAGSCESPMATTGTVYQDVEASDFSLASATGQGVVLSGTNPPGAYGVRGAFKYGGPGEHAWKKSEVVPLSGGNAGKFALKFAIGDGPVVFGVQAVVSPEEQAAHQATCDIPPLIQETQYADGVFSGVEGNHPWPNAFSSFFSVIN